MLLEFISLLDIDTTIVLSEDIDYTGSKDEALISICKELDVKNYLSVKGSMDYILDGVNLFEKIISIFTGMSILTPLILK